MTTWQLAVIVACGFLSGFGIGILLCLEWVVRERIKCLKALGKWPNSK